MSRPPWRVRRLVRDLERRLDHLERRFDRMAAEARRPEPTEVAQ